MSNKSKAEHFKDKEMKNIKALQENSLVNLAANRPDLYMPTTLPFFNDYNKKQEDEVPKLER